MARRNIIAEASRHNNSFSYSGKANGLVVLCGLAVARRTFRFSTSSVCSAEWSSAFDSPSRCSLAYSHRRNTHERRQDRTRFEDQTTHHNGTEQSSERLAKAAHNSL